MTKKKLQKIEKKMVQTNQNKEVVSVTNKDREAYCKEKFGISNAEMIGDIITQAALAVPGIPRDKVSEVSQKTSLSVMEMKPSDPIEAKLCAKEIVLYEAAMKYLKRAEDVRYSDSPGAKDVV